MGQKKRLRSIELQIKLASIEARNKCVEEIKNRQKTVEETKKMQMINDK